MQSRCHPKAIHPVRIPLHPPSISLTQQPVQRNEFDRSVHQPRHRSSRPSLRHSKSEGKQRLDTPSFGPMENTCLASQSTVSPALLRMYRRLTKLTDTSTSECRRHVFYKGRQTEAHPNDAYPSPRYQRTQLQRQFPPLPPPTPSHTSPSHLFATTLGMCTHLSKVYLSVFVIGTDGLLQEGKGRWRSGKHLRVGTTRMLSNLQLKMSPPPRLVGAVNTITPSTGGSSGHNTDWLGIKNHSSNILLWRML